MIVSVDDNPNCPGCGVMRFESRSLARRVARVDIGHGAPNRVTGWGPDGPEPARARRIADSGDGLGWLVSGGPWGVRVAPDDAPWDVHNAHQEGFPYLVVPERDDLVFL